MIPSLARRRAVAASGRDERARRWGDEQTLALDALARSRALWHRRGAAAICYFVAALPRSMISAAPPRAPGSTTAAVAHGDILDPRPERLR
jgi:hypothetical protein